MTREAVMNGFEQFVGDALEETGREFQISGVLGGSSGGMIDRFISKSDSLHEKLVEPELKEYREETVAQFDVLLDFVESDDPIEQFRDDILQTGPFTSNIREDISSQQREIVYDRLLERQYNLGMAVEPLVESEESNFWHAAEEELTKNEAKQLVEENFAFTGPLREHRDAFAMTTTFKPDQVMGGIGGMLGSSAMEVDYTDEAMRAMRHAEREVIADVKTKVDEQFE